MKKRYLEPDRLRAGTNDDKARDEYLFNND